MDVYALVIHAGAQVLALGNRMLAEWVTRRENATGPLDPNIALTTSGGGLMGYLATLAVDTSALISGVAATLFSAVP